MGGVDVKNPVWLAPLAGITTPSVRLFFKSLGAGLAHTEMISCAGLAHGSRKTFSMLRRIEGEGPLVLQLFAPDETTLLEGARRSLGCSSFEAISINMACPMPKVTRRGAGSSLLERPKTAAAMVRALTPLGLPVWAKIRKPPPASSMDTLSFSGMLLEAGASHVCIHGRTPAQKYEGRADKDAVVRSAKAFPGMIAASGDVFSIDDVLGLLKEGCSAVFVARGALKDPLLIPQTLHRCGFPAKERMLVLEVGPRVGLMISLGERMLQEEGEKAALVLLKRLLSGMFRGFNGASRFRRTLSAASDWQGMCGAFEEWRSSPERSEFCDRREVS
ncbi:MAG TPA: tRNA-dihydrouridine synthase family protein [Synergistales bacterium]|nr:tRNA-dihydrouridine synthase family protein [Synergistales bacterium]